MFDLYPLRTNTRNKRSSGSIISTSTSTSNSYYNRIKLEVKIYFLPD